MDRGSLSFQHAWYSLRFGHFRHIKCPRQAHTEASTWSTARPVGIKLTQPACLLLYKGDIIAPTWRDWVQVSSPGLEVEVPCELPWPATSSQSFCPVQVPIPTHRHHNNIKRTLCHPCSCLWHHTVSALKSQAPYSLCKPGYVNLTQARVVWEEGASVEKTPPPGWPVGKLGVRFLN